MSILKYFTKTQNKKSEQEIIEEIHNEFDTAPDRLLEQTIEKINENESSKILLTSEIENNAERLKKIGFINNPLVNKLEDIKFKNSKKDEVIKMQTEEANTIKYYSETYPFIKFLTEVELDRICDKYGLIYAPVNHYKESVPTKNLEEIENSQSLKLEDSIKDYYKLKVNKGIKTDISSNIIEQLKDGNTFQAVTKRDNPYLYEFRHKDYYRELQIIESKDYYSQYPYNYIVTKEDIKNYNIINNIINKNNSYRFSSIISNEDITKYDLASMDRRYDLYNLELKYPSADEYMLNNFSYDHEFDVLKQEREGLFIAAPKEHFDLKGLTKDGKGYYKLDKKSIVKKDPIVFRYVQGGIQILTKWGLEAEDKDLQLPIFN